MKLIVGLGNPGEKYEKTRHNLGFLVVEHFLKDFSPTSDGNWHIEKKFKGELSELSWQPKVGKAEKVILLKPTTFMNLSGESVKAVSEYYHVLPEDMWIVHDELDLPLGSLKIRVGGTSAGHKGIQSIMDHLGTEKFWRFRMGIGMSHTPSHVDGDRVQPIARMKIHDVDEFVIGKFSGKELTEVKKLVKHTSDALETALEKDLHTAQNRFNTK